MLPRTAPIPRKTVFTDINPHGVEGVFSAGQVDELIQVLEAVRRRAVA